MIKISASCCFLSSNMSLYSTLFIPLWFNYSEVLHWGRCSCVSSSTYPKEYDKSFLNWVLELHFTSVVCDLNLRMIWISSFDNYCFQYIYLGFQFVEHNVFTLLWLFFLSCNDSNAAFVTFSFINFLYHFFFIVFIAKKMAAKKQNGCRNLQW